MEKTYIIVLVISLALAAGIITAVCTEASSSANSSGNSQQYAPSSGNRPFSGQMQNFLTNETLLAAAADKLGVSEQDLQNALTTTSITTMSPNFTAAAQQLYVTRQQLTDALGMPAGGFSGNRSFSGQMQSFLTNETLLAAAVDKLGVSEQDLQNALTTMGNTTNIRPNFTAAAQLLNVTPQQLTDALGMPAGGRIRSGGYNATQAQGQ